MKPAVSLLAALGAASVAIVGLAVLAFWHTQRAGPTAGSEGLTPAGSPIAAPFGVGKEIGSSPAEGISAARVLAGKRVAVMAGGKPWRFAERVGRESAAHLYARISQSPEDPTRFEAIADFAEVMTQCRVWQQRKQLRLIEPRQSKSHRSTQQTVFAANQEAIERDGPRCADAPADAVLRSDQWLTQAAEAGDSRARYLYGSVNHLSWLADATAASRNPEALADYKSRAFDYLRDLAAQGHVESLERLSVLYASPAYGDDRVLSWAYAAAAYRAQNNHEAQRDVLKLLDNLPQADRARALKEADAIYLGCCK